MISVLSPLTLRWFSNRFDSPTRIQEETWKAAAEGNHLLAVAPTGSGKTLAAFLVSLDRLLQEEDSRKGLKVLYISPLKALGNDIKENLGTPLQELKVLYAKEGNDVPELRVGIRNGDTTPYERRKQLKDPPDILITTPESLGILLLSKSGRLMLSTIETCIIDEIHAIAPDRRGTLLSCHLERLADLAGEFQRIGLTATVNPVERAAAFLGGYLPADSEASLLPRDVKIIAPPASKKIEIDVEVLPSPPESITPDPDAFWREIASRIRDGIQDKRATLAFLDSRKWVEKLTRLINEGCEEPLAWAHHGSLSKDMRRLVERRLKDGTLRAVVATGSLELGIDIGPLDEVLLMGSPVSASKALQRAGRAGHRPEETSRARIFPIHPPDMLAATVMAGIAKKGCIENLHIPENPLDILAQLIVALCTEKGRTEEELLNLVRRSWSYRDLPRKSFDSVLAMLRGRFAETRLPALKPVIYQDSGRLVARPGMRMRLFTGGGAIPDLGMYGVKQLGVEGNIGSLDEKFVWESQPGLVFFLGNRRWKIASIDDRNVTVVPTDQPESTEPFWRAEAANRDPEFAGRIADLLETAEACISEDEPRSPEVMLGEDYGLQPEQAGQLGQYLRDQRRRSGTALPHRHHIVAEAALDPETGDQPGVRSLFLHTFLGGKVNWPLALSLQAAWAGISPTPITPTVTDDTIAFTINETDFDTIILMLKTLGNPEDLIRGVLESTSFFGGRFRESAGRALLLPSSTLRKRQPLWMTRQRSRALMEAVSGYPDFPIMTEVWRTFLNDEFDMDALDNFLRDVASGDIRISKVFTKAPSPFTGTAVRRRLSRRMTANMKDQGESRLVSGLESSEIRRLSRAGNLRPEIPGKLAIRLDRRRRRVEAGYAPGSIEALKAWIAEREAFDEQDWSETLEAVSTETGRPIKALENTISAAVQTVSIGPGAAIWRITTDAVSEWKETFTMDNPRSAAFMAAFWLGGRGPVTIKDLLERFGLKDSPEESKAFLEALSEMDEQVTVDQITDTAKMDTEVCDSEGMEILLRWRRRQSRNSDAPLPVSKLAGFLAGRQGLGGELAGEDAVRSALEVLEGYPLPAKSWEESVLPVRMPVYRSTDLDRLVGQEEFIWVGAGDGKVVWLSAEGGWRYPPPEAGGTPGSNNEIHASEAFPEPGEVPRDFWKIAESLGSDSSEATRAIWNQVWKGRLTSGDASVLRRGVATGFKAEKLQPGKRLPGGIRGWSAGRPVSGRWYAPAYAEKPEDPMASDILMREQIRLLARRYGILSRPLLEKEIHPWRWHALSRTLGLMELGDELIGGRWFDGLPMPQFLLPEALPYWREGAIPGRPWCMEAIDPASPCGLASDKDLPDRRVGTWLAWDEDGRLSWVMKPRSRTLEFFGSTEGDGAVRPLKLIATAITERDVSPRNRLVISTINGDEADESSFGGLLEDAGFESDGTGNRIRRARPVGMRN